LAELQAAIRVDHQHQNTTNSPISPRRAGQPSRHGDNKQPVKRGAPAAGRDPQAEIRGSASRPTEAEIRGSASRPTEAGDKRLRPHDQERLEIRGSASRPTEAGDKRLRSHDQERLR